MQVLLQTYIEYLRGKVEDKKEMNHHGRQYLSTLKMKKNLLMVGTILVP